MHVPRETSPRHLYVMFITVVLTALAVLSLSWHASILDRYEFRQLQTALSTFWIARDGWQLAYPLPLFGPPWSVPMEFPSYQVIVANLHHLTGLPIEQAGRATGIFFLFASLPAIFDLLAVAGLRRSRRLIVLAMILSSPVYLFYSRTFMIETTAVCFSVWFLALFRRALDKPRPGWLVTVTLFAILAALTKITTFVLFGIPAAALAMASFCEARVLPRSTKDMIFKACLSVLLAALSLGLTWWWVRYSDAIKNSNPFTGFLNSHELHNWNFGPWALRADWSFWIKIQENIVSYNLAEGAIAIAILCVPFATRRVRLIASICLASFFSGPLIFANLYHIHDYYYTANSLWLTGAAGLLLASIWDDRRLPRSANWLALCLMLLFQGYAFYRGYYSHHRNPAPPPPALATIIRETVPPDGVVLIYGADWNPLLPYYFERRALMVPGEREHETDVLEQVIATLPPQHIAAMVIHGPRLLEQAEFIKERAHHFRLASEPFARSGSDELYLPTSVPPVATMDSSLEMFILPEKDAFSADLKPADLSVLDLSIFSPAPDAILSRYGVNSAEIEGQPVLNAHAPSKLIFSTPPGGKHIEAIVGIAPGAYEASSPAITDGITIEIIAKFTSGRSQRLFHRTLDPAKQSADRGSQKIEIDLPSEFSGQLSFRLGNGPANNPTNDWAFWESIRIR